MLMNKPFGLQSILSTGCCMGVMDVDLLLGIEQAKPL